MRMRDLLMPLCVVLASDEDKALTNAVVAAVRSEGMKCVRLRPPRHLGEDERLPWKQRRTLDRALIVLVVLSLDFERRSELRAAVKYAFSVRKMLLPYKIHPKKLSFGLQIMLGMSHWLDVSHMARPENGIQELHKAMAAHVRIFRKRTFVRRLLLSTAFTIPGIIIRAAMLCAGVMPFVLLVWEMTTDWDFGGLRFGNSEEKVEEPVVAGTPAASGSGTPDIYSGIGSSAGTGKGATAFGYASGGDSGENSDDFGSAAGKGLGVSDGSVERADGYIGEDDDGYVGGISSDEDEDDGYAPAGEPFLISLPDGGGTMKLVPVSGGVVSGSVFVPEFLLGETEVTHAQYRAVMKRLPEGTEKSGDYPADFVSLNDAQEFCLALTRFAREMGTLPRGMKFALPTLAQYRRAANGFEPTSSAEADAVAWYSENSGGGTHPVGQKNPTAFGLYDLFGNLWEWCTDSESDDYPCIFGKDFSKPADDFAANRVSLPVNSGFFSVRKKDIGFRIALVPDAEQTPSDDGDGFSCDDEIDSGEDEEEEIDSDVDSGVSADDRRETPPHRVVVGELVRALFPRGVAGIADAMKSSAPKTFAPTFPGRAFFIYRFRSVYDAASGKMRLLPDSDAMHEFFYANKDLIIPVNDLAASTVAVLRELPSRKNAGLAVPARFPAALPQIDPKADFAVVSYGGEVFAKGEFSAELQNPAARESLFVKLGDALRRAVAADEAAGTAVKRKQGTVAERRGDDDEGVVRKTEETPAASADSHWRKVFPKGLVRAGTGGTKALENFRMLDRDFVLVYRIPSSLYYASSDESRLKTLLSSLKKFFKKNKNRVVPVASGEPFETLHARLRKHNAYGYLSRSDVSRTSTTTSSSSNYSTRQVPYELYDSNGNFVRTGVFSYNCDGELYESELDALEKILRKN